MRPLRYSINITLDGCCDHRTMFADEDCIVTAVQQLKRESGKGLLMGGVKLPLAMAELGLIDEYEYASTAQRRFCFKQPAQQSPIELLLLPAHGSGALVGLETTGGQCCGLGVPSKPTPLTPRS